MAGLVPAIHVFVARQELETWMPGTRPGMTSQEAERCYEQVRRHVYRLAHFVRSVPLSAKGEEKRRTRRQSWNKISSGAENAAQGDGAGLAVSAANDAEAMEHAAL